ncbi:Transferase [Parasponia andersonii]|uniref:Transferase n=1 Tax=Parasponia andersonii TaxID=3476 RepID=A0A2P5CVH5_PARAD|nr:Transferase [Parasponia andersonii]
MNSHTVQHISECFVKPQCTTEESKQPFYLTPWDLVMLSVHYIQKGLLFSKPAQANEDGDFMGALLDRLKHSLSHALVHFYPLAGRFKTVKAEDSASCLVYVDCNDSPGAKLIYATLDMTISDILSPTDVPSIVQSFFDHDRAVNHDGHTLSLLSIQVTELVDGVFIGCSMSHAIADGTSYWNFFNMWSEIFRAQGNATSISRPPILQRWFPEGHGPKINLPYAHPDEFISGFEAPELRERVFHFSAEAIAKLKAKANAEYNTNKISSFQSLSALVWRCITRVRNLPPDQITSCRLAANNRSRLDPPISENYFGNVIYPIRGFTTAGELLEHDLRWAAWKLHEAVVNHNDKSIRGLLDAWLQSPRVYQLGQLFDPFSVMMGSSPRFNKYGIDFGMGKAVALRSGYGNKFSGKVSCYPGREAGGSIDLETCLPPATMSALESDKEFMEAACLALVNH